ncbi:MAG: radical SAM protein [Actinobacteria bacterium]|nr:radical SAM protein [Actinomycetota bacterium]
MVNSKRKEENPDKKRILDQRKMKILIINPPASNGIKYIREGRCEQRLSSFQYVMIPISLPSIAAVLRKNGFSVTIQDCIADNQSIDHVKNQIKLHQPQLVIINTSTATFNNDKTTIKAMKELSDAHIAAIGTHVTALPEKSLNQSELNSVIRREPELTALELAISLRDNKDLKNVQGISYKSKNGTINNPDRPFMENLDDLPYPARDLVSNQKYTMPLSNKPYTLLISSRGCPYDCIFCTANQYYGKKLRLRSPKNILNEIEEIIEKHNIYDIAMWSDTFTLNRNFVVEVCEEILRRGLKFNWMTNSRVDKIDPELLKLMKKSGCWIISYGVESGVQEIIDNIKKGTNIDQTRNAFKWSKEAGVETTAHIVLGLPGDTKETIQQTIDFIIKLDPDYTQFYCAIPFPGTEFYQMAIENDWLITNDWNRFEINQPILNTKLLSNEELKKAKKQAFKSFYLRPNYALKVFKRTKSPKQLTNTIMQGINFAKEWVYK